MSTVRQNKITLHEDWVVVILGFLVIIAALLGLNIAAPSYGWKEAGELFSKVLTTGNLTKILLQYLLVSVVYAVGLYLTGKSIKTIYTVFPIVFALTTLALIIAGNKQVKDINLEAVIFSLTLGLLIGNFVKLPEGFRAALSTELFVKIGLVLLGTSIIFGDILKAGFLGLLQALIVVLSVWYFAFWVCKKLKLDSDLTMMISSAVSICGVSAAIATAGAIKGDTKKLSYVISLVLVTAIPMMIVMPYIANYFHFPQEVTGAWLGGSIDTTGAVVASGTLVGETALKVSTIVKFSQNVLLGIAAFLISIYWAYNKKAQANNAEVTKPTLGLLWERFPKFVIGFVAASLFFSFALSSETVGTVKDGLKSIQTLWFVLAFTSIGLETKFSDLFNSESKKPLYAFLIAQTFNVFITLTVAFALFGQ
jgi:uncharacterized integral membrane protein (TIGR00698 family)